MYVAEIASEMPAETIILLGKRFWHLNQGSAGIGLWGCLEEQKFLLIYMNGK